MGSNMKHILKTGITATQHEHVGQKECVVRSSYCELTYVLYIFAGYVRMYKNNDRL